MTGSSSRRAHTTAWALEHRLYSPTPVCVRTKAVHCKAGSAPHATGRPLPHSQKKRYWAALAPLQRRRPPWACRCQWQTPCTTVGSGQHLRLVQRRWAAKGTAGRPEQRHPGSRRSHETAAGKHRQMSSQLRTLHLGVASSGWQPRCQPLALHHMLSQQRPLAGSPPKQYCTAETTTASSTIAGSPPADLLLVLNNELEHDLEQLAALRKRGGAPLRARRLGARHQPSHLHNAKAAAATWCSLAKRRGERKHRAGHMTAQPRNPAAAGYLGAPSRYLSLLQPA